MTDAVPIMEASRLGYEIVSDKDLNAWFVKGDRRVGPYKKLEDAAYAAIDEDEVRRYQDEAAE